jgi:hypothetical protein
VAVTFVTEIGDVNRIENPRQLMGYLGLVPSERSTGATIRRGGITKAGNGRVRHMLVESAWTYRHPPRIGTKKLYRLNQVPPKVREIAWKAQTRLTARYRALSGRGKKTTVICTAIARELVGFMWSVVREAQIAWTLRRCPLAHRRGRNHGRGNARQPLCGRPRADARCKIGTAPDAHSKMR